MFRCSKLSMVSRQRMLNLKLCFMLLNLKNRLLKMLRPFDMATYTRNCIKTGYLSKALLTELQPRQSLNVCRIWFHPYTERNADCLRTGIFWFKAGILFSLVQIELQSLLEEMTIGITMSLHARVLCYYNF